MVRPSSCSERTSVDAGLELGGVEAGQPLVEQQQVGRAGERAGKLDALEVEVGQRVAVRGEAPVEADAGEQALGLGAGGGDVEAAAAVHGGDGDVVAGVERVGDAGELEGAGDAGAADGLRRAPVMGVPAKRTSPAIGASRPETTLRSVVLPEPLGPIRPTTSPSADREGDAVERGEAAEVAGEAGTSSRGGAAALMARPRVVCRRRREQRRRPGPSAREAPARVRCGRAMRSASGLQQVGEVVRAAGGARPVCSRPIRPSGMKNTMPSSTRPSTTLK